MDPKILKRIYFTETHHKTHQRFRGRQRWNKPTKPSQSSETSQHARGSEGKKGSGSLS